MSTRKMTKSSISPVTPRKFHRAVECSDSKDFAVVRLSYYLGATYCLPSTTLNNVYMLPIAHGYAYGCFQDWFGNDVYLRFRIRKDGMGCHPCSWSGKTTNWEEVHRNMENHKLATYHGHPLREPKMQSRSDSIHYNDHPEFLLTTVLHNAGK